MLDRFDKFEWETWDNFDFKFSLPDYLHVSIDVLVHPCDKADKGGCEQTCEKKGEEDLVCTCGEGFKLNADGKKCDKSK